MADLRELLVCPACRSELLWSASSASCTGCATSFSIDDGLPVLAVGLDKLKQKQAEWFDNEADPEYEIERPHGTPAFHAWLLDEKFRRSVSALRSDLRGSVVLCVCAGSGMDAEFLSRSVARVIAADISPGAARRTRERAFRQGLAIEPIVADVEHLPFRDSSIDLVYVHDGLHHLEQPLAGLAEMARVARRGVSVNEPARAAATAVSVKVGYSGDVEEAGNRVERLQPADVERVLRSAGFEIVRSERYAMVYRHVAGRPVRFFSARAVSPLARTLFRAANVVLGRIGNKLTVQAIRPERRRILVHDYAGHSFPVQLSRELARRGNDVLHLHCPSYPNGRGAVELLLTDPPTFQSERLPLAAELRKYSPWKRPLQEIEYGRRLAARIRDFRPDCVVSGNTPLIAQAVALRSSRRMGVPFVFWQQDLHGLAMRAIARTRMPLVGCIVGPSFPALERRLLRRSDSVVTISDGFVETLQAWGIPSERVHLIENWAPLEELPLRERDGAWRRANALGSGPVLLYCGTLGLKHDTDLLFELARRVASRGATVVVASEGIGAEALARRLAAEPLASLRVLPFQPYEQLAEMLGAADVLLALLGRVLGSYSVPSKVLTYLCAGRPLLAAVPSENPAAQLIERTRSGIVVEPEDVDGFFLGAERLLDDAALRAELGARGRTYAESAFSITEIGDRFERVLAQTMPTRGKDAAASDPRQLEAVHTPR